MQTITEITIEPESPGLTGYTHCASRYSAELLAKAIMDLERAGFTVLNACGMRASVPNVYKSAYKMHAPFYKYHAGSRTIELVDGKLENRAIGAAIPAVYEISGQRVPEGYRCFARLEASVIVRSVQR